MQREMTQCHNYLLGSVNGVWQQELSERTRDALPIVEEFVRDTAQGRMLIRLMYVAQVV